MTEMSEMERLIEIVRRLRAADGCPWDRAQTHESLKPMCIEEAAEVICGINILKEKGDPENLREELGDLLFQVVFHASLAEEEGYFTLEDVARTVSDKMVRRHPHVFAESKYSPAPQEDAGRAENGQAEKGAGRAKTVRAEAASWEEIKRAEKEGREWQRPYLASAMEEAGELIEVAMKRKGFRKG